MSSLGELPGTDGRASQPQFLKRAAFAGDRLWLLSDHGELSSIRDGERVRSRERLPGRILDLCAWGETPAVLACETRTCSTWRFLRRSGEDWTAEKTIGSRGEALVGLSCEPEGLLVLTDRRLIDLGSSPPRSLHLSKRLDPGLVASLHARTEEVFVGLNAGEWGGGLWRIDRGSGEVGVIEKNASGELCGGPLNTECDPVHGIVTAPWASSCVIAAIGLVHFMPHGRLIEVCGGTVRRLYHAPYGDRPDGGASGAEEELEPEAPGRGDDEPFSTVAFFGLVRSGDELWAVSFEGLYRIREGEVERVGPLPEPQEVDGVWVSFEYPSLVLVLTRIHQRASVSGALPMVVAREPG